MDQALNLIPFIAFLSVIVAFLIAGAAWVQLAQIQIALPSQPAPGQQKQDKGPELTLTIIMTLNQLQIAGSGAALPPIKNKPDEVDPNNTLGIYDLEGLEKKLKEIQDKFPDNRDVIMAVQSAVKYKDIVSVMDICLKNNIDGISLAPYTSPDEIKARAGK